MHMRMRAYVYGVMSSSELIYSHMTTFLPSWVGDTHGLDVLPWELF